MALQDSRRLTGLLGLPVELLSEIIEFGSLQDHLSLCRVCADFYSLTIPAIYRCLHLKSCKASIAKCARTLASKCLAARSVRRLEVHESMFVSTPNNLSLTKAFDGMKNLQYLILRVNEKPYREALRSATFPRLRLFECPMKLNSLVILFLERHQTLTNLSLHVSWAARRSSQNLQPITLPNLQEFRGELQHLQWVGRGAPLTHVSLDWCTDIDNIPLFEEAIDILKGSNSLVLLRFMRPSNNVAQLDTISQKLPNLEMLLISNIELYSRINEAQAKLVRTYLARMKYLFALNIAGEYDRGPGKRKFAYDEDHETVLAIAKQCPTLAICNTPRNITWFAHQNGLWIPDSQDYHGARWALIKRLNDENPNWRDELNDIAPDDWDTLWTKALADWMGLLDYSDEEEDLSSDSEDGGEDDSDLSGPEDSDDEAGNAEAPA